MSQPNIRYGEIFAPREFACRNREHENPTRIEASEQLCVEARVKLLYLPPYSPDLNPIEELFAELKTFIKRNWHHCCNTVRHDFGALLEWYIDNVGQGSQVLKAIFGMLVFQSRSCKSN